MVSFWLSIFYSCNQILNITKIIMHYALCIMHYKKE